jgi:hypothetical protein
LRSEDPEKIAENCRKIVLKRGKIAVFGKGNCGWGLEIFCFPSHSGQGKGRKKSKSKLSQSPAENMISHICG